MRCERYACDRKRWNSPSSTAITSIYYVRHRYNTSSTYFKYYRPYQAPDSYSNSRNASYLPTLGTTQRTSPAPVTSRIPQTLPTLFATLETTQW